MTVSPSTCCSLFFCFFSFFFFFGKNKNKKNACVSDLCYFSRCMPDFAALGSSSLSRVQITLKRYLIEGIRVLRKVNFPAHSLGVDDLDWHLQPVPNRRQRLLSQGTADNSCITSPWILQHHSARGPKKATWTSFLARIRDYWIICQEHCFSLCCLLTAWVYCMVPYTSVPHFTVFSVPHLRG